MMRIANKLKNLIKKNKRFKQTSIENVEDIKESYFGKEAQIDTSKDLQNVEQDEVKELTYSHNRWMELGLLLKKWSKFGGIELQLLYCGKL